jgi:hypothetical protein
VIGVGNASSMIANSGGHWVAWEAAQLLAIAGLFCLLLAKLVSMVLCDIYFVVCSHETHWTRCS